MKRIALAFLLLPLFFCLAAENADELFLRSTVRKPDLIIWSSVPAEHYTPELIANIDKSMELLRYQLDLGLGINPSTFISDIAKARPEKLLITASHTLGEEFWESFGFDVLLALKTVKPMNAQLFIGGLQMLATIMQSPKPVITDSSISLTVVNVPITLQFLADKTIMLLGRTSTITAIKEGTNATFKFPKDIKAPFFVTLAMPPELRPQFAEILPDGFPAELSQITSLTLTINHETLVRLTLTAAFPDEGNARAIASQLTQLREQASTLCNGEPTLTKYLQKTNITHVGTICSVTAEVPWQVLASAIPASMLMPALSSAREKARAISCVSNLKQLALMMLMYATDHDDMLPAADTWEKDIKEYNGEGKLLFCPAAPDHKYIYYGKKVKMSDIQHPSKTILMSEDFANHEKNSTVNICFLDGHVESVKINGETTIEEIAETHHFEFIQ